MDRATCAACAIETNDYIHWKFRKGGDGTPYKMKNTVTIHNYGFRKNSNKPTIQ